MDRMQAHAHKCDNCGLVFRHTTLEALAALFISIDLHVCRCGNVVTKKYDETTQCMADRPDRIGK